MSDISNIGRELEGEWNKQILQMLVIKTLETVSDSINKLRDDMPPLKPKGRVTELDEDIDKLVKATWAAAIEMVTLTLDKAIEDMKEI